MELSLLDSGGLSGESCHLIMGKLLLLAALALAAFFGMKGCPPPPPPPPATPTPIPAAKIERADPRVVAAGNDFFIYTRVKKMYRDWMERTVGTLKSQPPGARNEDLSLLLTEIRDRLGERPYRLHKMESVEEVMLVSLGRPDRDLNVPADQRRHVLTGILAEAARDGQK